MGFAFQELNQFIAYVGQGQVCIAKIKTGGAEIDGDLKFSLSVPYDSNLRKSSFLRLYPDFLLLLSSYSLNV